MSSAETLGEQIYTQEDMIRRFEATEPYLDRVPIATVNPSDGQVSIQNLAYIPLQVIRAGFDELGKIEGPHDSLGNLSPEWIIGIVKEVTGADEETIFGLDRNR